MQFVVLSMAFLAALATAEHHGPRHFHHRRQMNATVADTHTTLTVFQTQVYTITSCAPTITNCPARSSAGNGVITDTVAITTTVCPITAAESVKSSILSAIGGSSTSVASAAPSAIGTFPIHLSTGVAAPVGGSASSGSPVTDATLTYTLGSGSSTTVITTTIKHTTTEIEYVTQYITHSSTASAAATTAVAGGGAGGQSGAQTSGQAQGVGGKTDIESTTTITSSSTVTRYITVQRVTPTPATPVNNNGGGVGTGAVPSEVGSGSGSGSGNGGCTPVTVTVAMSTVTVTYTPMAASPVAASSAAPVGASSITPAAASSVAANGYEVSSPTATAASAAATSAVDVVAAPASSSSIIPSGGAPYGNGTEPCTQGKASGTAASTGFLTMAKPTASMYGY